MLDHSMQPPSLDQSSATPNERVAPSPSSEAVPQEILGNALIMVDHSTFLDGYLHGYRAYTRVGRYLPLTASILRDVLLKRCLEQPDQTSLWNTGYLVGWITAMQQLPRRQRLCPLERATPHLSHFHWEEPQHEDTGDDHPTEEALIHFFVGQVSAKAYKRALVPVSYPYRIGFALGQLNEAVATMGTWPAGERTTGHVVPPPEERDKAEEEGRMA
jgi:hypothetical protein